MPLKILLLLLTIASVASAAFPQKAQPSSYCELFKAPISKDGRVVTTEAYMTYSTVGRVDGGDSFLYGPNCNNEDYFAIAHFAKKLPKSTHKFFSGLPNEKQYVLKLVVTGRLRTSFLPLFGHLGWSRSQFDIDTIESISNVTTDSQVVRPDLVAEAPLTEAARLLRDLNSDIVLNLLSGTVTQQTKNSLHTSFSLTDPNGKDFSADQLTSVSLKNLFPDNIDGFDRRAIRQPTVEIVGEEYVATGLFWVENALGSKKTLEYRNVYCRDEDSFLLMKTSLRSISNNAFER